MGLARAAIVLALGPMLAGQTGELPVETVLSRAADYLDRYERAIEGVTAVEVYTQVVGRSRKRVLQSDVLFIPDDQFGWIEFRDVARVDGALVGDRERRVENLFVKPTPDRLAQAQRIVAEGARFNLNPVDQGLNRTLNLPLTALRYLRGAAQQRSSFRLVPGPAETTHVVLEFTERSRPRLITTDDHRPARGRFELDASSGRVMASELRIQTRSVVAVFQVIYSEEPRLGLWLPRSMSESYSGLAQRVSGSAEYSILPEVPGSDRVRHREMSLRSLARSDRFPLDRRFC